MISAVRCPRSAGSGPCSPRGLGGGPRRNGVGATCHPTTKPVFVNRRLTSHPDRGWVRRPNILCVIAAFRATVPVMSIEQLRLHEIAETDHRILNPFTADQLALLGEVCHLRPGMRQLDLACGKGEMLCTWARDYGVEGIGVDLSAVFLDSAGQRAAELGVADRVEFVAGDAAKYQAQRGGFDVVSCIGATWIGDGLAGTLELLRPALRDGGLMLVGEPFWSKVPPDAAYAAVGTQPGEFVSLAQTAERFSAGGFDLVEMVLATPGGWDRYIAQHWWAVDRWLREHPGHPDASALRNFCDTERTGHLTYGRRFFNWGVFVLRQKM